MARAAVLIGVKKAHTLPTLQAVQKCIDGMSQWADSQDMDHIVKITDQQQPVDATQIGKAIRDLVDQGTLEQLIVYFSGHGVNIGYQEYWLLSDAIVDTKEAVNVAGSETLARFCRIPHVVFISDACRTAASGIQAQALSGSEIFPNRGAGGLEDPVDIFYATLLGQPALEIKNPRDAANQFSAIYTDALLDAINGRHRELLERDAATGLSVVRPRPLKAHLIKELAKRATSGGASVSHVSQRPDARISSDTDAWVSRVQAAPSVAPSDWTLPQPPSDLQSLAQAALRTALDPTKEDASSYLALAGSRGMPSAGQLASTISFGAAPFGPMHYETGCGFKIRNAAVSEVFCRDDVKAEILDTERTLVRITLPDAPFANVVLTFKNATSVVLPAIRDFLAGLTFDGDELVDVSYEPSEYSWRWKEFQEHERESRSLRAIIAAASRLGTFELEGDDARNATTRMQHLKGIDPSLTLYAAHAYRTQGRHGRIREMAEYLHAGVNMYLFDVAMLARLLDGRVAGSRNDVGPFLPLLTQGWALLAAHEIKFPPSLKNIRRHVTPYSLWTLYDRAGLPLLREAIVKKEVR